MFFIQIAKSKFVFAPYKPRKSKTMNEQLLKEGVKKICIENIPLNKWEKLNSIPSFCKKHIFDRRGRDTIKCYQLISNKNVEFVIMEQEFKSSVSISKVKLVSISKYYVIFADKLRVMYYIIDIESPNSSGHISGEEWVEDLFTRVRRNYDTRKAIKKEKQIKILLDKI